MERATRKRLAEIAAEKAQMLFQCTRAKTI